MKKKISAKKVPETPQTLKLTMTDLDSEGIGQAPHEDKTALVPGAFPGETIIAAVEHSGRTHIYTRLHKILRSAPERTVNRLCRQDRDCLGCTLINMKYADQLLFKRQRVAQAFHDQGLLERLTVPPVLPAENPVGYRAGAKLVCARKRDRILIGLYKRGTHEVIDGRDCPLHHPLINRIIAVVADEVRNLKLSVYDPGHRRGCLRYLLIRVSPENAKALVTFVSNYRELRLLPKLAKRLSNKVPEVIGVHQNVNSSGGNVIIGPETLKLQGLPDLIEQVGDIRLRMSPTSFFQVNPGQATKIYQLIRTWAGLSHRDTAVDLYCGIGGIALHLATDAGRVFGIESVRNAVINATENAALNNLNHCRFVAGDVAQELHKLPLGGKKPDLVTLNPPRKGCAEKVLQSLIQLGPKTIIYVSCDPDSLARDLNLLCGQGYAPVRLQPVDMFPQTPHIETVVQLKKGITVDRRPAGE